MTSSASSSQLPRILLGALIGGLILNLMPCVFPVLAIKVLAFAKHADDRAAHRRSGLAYTAGVVVSFLALGGLLLALRAAGEQLGWSFQLQSPAVVATLAALFTVIGLNLAGIPIKNMAPTDFDKWMQGITFVCVALVAVFSSGMVQRLLILVGLLLACVLYWLFTNVMGYGTPIDFSAVQNAAWLGLPSFSAPVFELHAMTVIVPVAIILVAENLGHIKAVSAMTGQDLDGYLGRAFVGDGVATMLSGAVGGTGVTTYAENIGVMAATRIYSTLIFAFAAVIAIFLGFSPKFGAVIQSIPGPVLGGMSVVVFGLIAIAGARIWVVNQVDFSDNRNLLVAAVTLILGAGNFSLQFGVIRLDGIGCATFGAIILHALLRGRSPARG